MNTVKESVTMTIHFCSESRDARKKWYNAFQILGKRKKKAVKVESYS